MLAVARRLGVLTAIVVVLALLAASSVYNLRQRRLALEKARSTEVTLTKAPAPNADEDSGEPDAQGAALTGKVAPAFSLTDLSGKQVTLAQFKGHPVVVNFWATWCGPCKLEMPWFEAAYSKYKPQGLVVLGLSQDEGTAKDTIAAAAKQIGVSYPILLPDENVAKAYGGVDYLPETFYVDAKGRIVEHTAGAPSEDEIDANVEKTIAAGQ
jgi:peroxiredoxin